MQKCAECLALFVSLHFASRARTKAEKIFKIALSGLASLFWSCKPLLVLQASSGLASLFWSCKPPLVSQASCDLISPLHFAVTRWVTTSNIYFAKAIVGELGLRIDSLKTLKLQNGLLNADKPSLKG
jgi:hypothetical protein